MSKRNDKKKYSGPELNSILLEFFSENPGMKITYLGLQKATGIDRFIWSRRMKQEIADLNNRPISNPTFTAPIEITNIAQGVKSLLNKPKELDRYLRTINIIIQNLVSKALEYDKLTVKLTEAEKANQEKDETINILKESIKKANKTHFSNALNRRYRVTKSPKDDVTNILRKPQESAVIAFLTKKGIANLFEDTSDS